MYFNGVEIEMTDSGLFFGGAVTGTVSKSLFDNVGVAIVLTTGRNANLAGRRIPHKPII